MRRCDSGTRPAVVLALACLLIGTACSPHVGLRPTADDDPPAVPPSVAVNGTPVPVLSSEWYSGSDGSISTQHPDDPGDTSGLPRTAAEDGRIRIRVVPGSRPSGLDVRFFLDVDGSGVPASPQPTISCTEPGSVCDWGPGEPGEHLGVEVRSPEGARFLTVTLTYDVPLFPSIAPPTSRAAYGVFLD